MAEQKVLLIIMDGWGLAENPSVSAIHAAQTPFIDRAMEIYPHTRLEASGLAVGLPEGQMGNSEVGHMNIGAGRIVYQDLVRITNELESGAFAQNPTFQSLVSYCKDNEKPLHLLGLLSDGGVHSTIHHLKGIVQELKHQGVQKVYIHAFTDGRDTSPQGGISYVKELQTTLDAAGVGQIASVIGRYFAMDRDKRWERVAKAYNLLVKGEGSPTQDLVAALQASYDAGVTDEFVEPIVCTDDEGQPLAKITEGDALLFFNFRTDRGRQLTQALSQTDFPEEGMHKLDLHYVTMTRYDNTFEHIGVLYEKQQLANGLGEYLSKQGKTQLRIAETEKYPHVTFFFNGGREKPMEGEQHLMCPSPKVATYDLQPEMSAAEIRDKAIAQIQASAPDFICLNFANPDMVGHTGVFEAAVKACEIVDGTTQAVTEAALEKGYVVLITADHGNADKMQNTDGSTHTAHTTALVPLFLVDKSERFHLAEQIGKLGDLAPSILHIMGLDIPTEMSGEVIVKEKHSVS
ncbi:MAG: 2,3-bisphosphoglycerate-independent phosphoglycerate mutase [Bacteroidota bacterium]